MTKRKCFENLTLNRENRTMALDEQQKAAMAQYAAQQGQPKNDMDQIVEIGRTNLGSEYFDHAADKVVGKLGPERAEVLRVALPHTNVPDQIVAHLYENENRLEAASRMSPDQLIIELARIEAERGPRTAHGHEPAWRDQAKNGGRVSDERWRTTGGAELNDAAWHREFDRRNAIRNKRR